MLQTLKYFHLASSFIQQCKYQETQLYWASWYFLHDGHMTSYLFYEKAIFSPAVI